MFMKNNDVVLCVLDGWGVGDPNSPYNAIAASSTKNWDRLISSSNYSSISASGLAVGLPDMQIGNSEVGHLTIGSGRIIKSHLLRINEELNSPEISEQIRQFTLKAQTKRYHIAGLASTGGVHSHLTHMLDVISIVLKMDVEVFVHIFLDGRDTAMRVIESDIIAIQKKIPLRNIVTVTGRFYSMDRDNRQERTDAAFNAIIHAEGERFSDIKQLISERYQHGISDEFFPPSVLDIYNGYLPGDAVIMINFRADRMIQITQKLIDLKLAHGENTEKKIMTMTEYSPNFATSVLFNRQKPKNTLGQVLSSNGLTQLRLAETEKYPHVTFFFNGGMADQFPLEDRVIIPSPKVSTYDEVPEMSAQKITDVLIKKIKSRKYRFIIVNYANADMVGHTGDFHATCEAITTLDKCIGRILEVVAKLENSVLILTADHGNAEVMLDEITRCPHTAHTLNPVPCMVIKNGKAVNIHRSGELADIAPTVLQLLEINKPDEMTGMSLLE